MGAWLAPISCTTLKPWASTPAPSAMGQWMLPPTQVGASLVSDRSGSLQQQHRQLITMTCSMSLRQQRAAPTCQHRAPPKLLLCVLGLAPVTSHSQAPALSSWCTSVSCFSQGQPSTRCFVATNSCVNLLAGYVHGRHPEICPHKCKPQLHIGKGETKKQTLIREAIEFQASALLLPAC